jgi:hypothetical protein
MSEKSKTNEVKVSEVSPSQHEVKEIKPKAYYTQKQITPSTRRNKRKTAKASKLRNRLQKARSIK